MRWDPPDNLICLSVHFLTIIIYLYSYPFMHTKHLLGRHDCCASL